MKKRRVLFFIESYRIMEFAHVSLIKGLTFEGNIPGNFECPYIDGSLICVTTCGDVETH